MANQPDSFRGVSPCIQRGCHHFDAPISRTDHRSTEELTCRLAPCSSKGLPVHLRTQLVGSPAARSDGSCSDQQRHPWQRGSSLTLRGRDLGRSLPAGQGRAARHPLPASHNLTRRLPVACPELGRRGCLRSIASLVEMRPPLESAGLFPASPSDVVTPSFDPVLQIKSSGEGQRSPIRLHEPPPLNAQLTGAPTGRLISIPRPRLAIRVAQTGKKLCAGDLPCQVLEVASLILAKLFLLCPDWALAHTFPVRLIPGRGRFPRSRMLVFEKPIRGNQSAGDGVSRPPRQAHALAPPSAFLRSSASYKTQTIPSRPGAYRPL